MYYLSNFSVDRWQLSLVANLDPQGGMAAVQPDDEMISRMLLPPVQRGVRVLDKPFFRKNVQITAATQRWAVKRACERGPLRNYESSRLRQNCI